MVNILPELYERSKVFFYEKIVTLPFSGFLAEKEFLLIIVRVVFFFGLGTLIYFMFFALYGFIISFFAPFLIKGIQKKYYPDLKLEGMGIFSMILLYLKIIPVTILLFILVSPTYLIPGLNLLILLPMYYFFHKTLVFDVSSIINTKKEYKKIKKANWNELKGQTLPMFALGYIPILGILLYPYYILHTGHFILNETRTLRYINNFHGIK